MHALSYKDHVFDSTLIQNGTTHQPQSKDGKKYKIKKKKKIVLRKTIFKLKKKSKEKELSNVRE